MPARKSQPVLVTFGVAVCLLLLVFGCVSVLWHAGRIVLVESWTITRPLSGSMQFKSISIVGTSVTGAGDEKIHVARRVSRFGGSESINFRPSAGMRLTADNPVKPANQWLPLFPKSANSLTFSGPPPRTDYHWTLNWKK